MNYNERINNNDSIVKQTITELLDRAEKGKIKYGTDLDRTDLSLSEWLQHAIEEHMDAILYLKKIKSMIDGKKKY